METRTWVSDNLIKLAGASDSTTVDFILATAAAAKSSSDLSTRLSSVIDGSPVDIDAFSADLITRIAPTKTRSSAHDGGTSSKNGSQREKKKKYTLVDMERAEDLDEISTTRSRDRQEHPAKKEARSTHEERDDRRSHRHRSDHARKNLRRHDEADFEDRWADQDFDEEMQGVEEDQMFAEPEPKRRKVSAEEDEPVRRASPNGRDAVDGQTDAEDDETRDRREKEEYEARLREKERASKRQDARGGRVDNRDMQDIRLDSRQKYLAKREAERLFLLRRQVEEEAVEEQENAELTAAEKEQFRRNRELLALAEQRRRIDEHTDGYAIPTENLEDKSHKQKLLNDRHVDRDQFGREVFVTDEQQWEAEQSAKARAQVKRAERDQGNYEYVFDESQRLQYVLDAASQQSGPKMTAEERALQERLTAAQQKAQSIEEVRKTLPVYEYRETFLEAMDKYQFLVIVGETGSGKTTQLPQYLREAGYCKQRDANGNPLKIGITQPRRVAAMSVAQRVSDETGTRLGKEVGYSIRFEDKTSPDTELKYMTDGMLMRELMTDPLLSSYAAIMIDEAHERSVATDVLMALIKDIARERSDLKVAVMSATVNSQKFSAYFEDCPILNIPGRRYNVDVYYSPSPEANYLAAAITTVFQIHISTPVRRKEDDLPGDILVFLTGQDEIEQAAQSIDETMRKLGSGGNSKVAELIVVPIYANLPPDMQRKIFEPTPLGTRKVVLATNIAETSLTIDSVVYVIDSGFSKVNIFNPRTGMESLIAEPISRASANQRTGRAGRVCAGKCFRLWTKHAFYNDMPEETTPEIQRTSIASLVLLLKSLGVEDLLNFDFIDPPPPDTIIKALELLYSLGALNDKGALTKIGRQMAEMPIDPMKSKAILQAGKLGCTSEILSIVAMLDETAALFVRPKAGDSKRIQADSTHARFRIPDNKSDHLALLNIFEQWADAEFSPVWANEMFLNQRSLTRARDVRDQLAKLLDRVEVDLLSCGLQDAEKILKAMTAGYFPNAARLQRDGQSYRAVGTGGGGLSVHIHPSSGLLEERPRWVVYDSLVLTSREFMRNCYVIKAEWLVEAAPHFHKQKDLDKLGGTDKKVSRGQGAPASKF